MKRNPLFIVCIILFLGAVPFIFTAKAMAQFDPMPPILDGSKHNLKLYRSHGYKGGPIKKEEFDVPWLSYVRKDVVKKFKSQKSTYVEEFWKGSNRSVSIKRWEFDNLEDPVLWVESGIETNGWPPIWSEKADVGDKTWWIMPHDMFFIKGNVLVRVFVTPMHEDEKTKNYTKKIAQNIADKL
jgi:hypothetical protein